MEYTGVDEFAGVSHKPRQKWNICVLMRNSMVWRSNLPGYGPVPWCYWLQLQGFTTLTVTAGWAAKTKQKTERRGNTGSDYDGFVVPIHESRSDNPLA